MNPERTPVNRYGPLLRALDALEAFEHSTWLTTSELASMVGMDPSSAHRMAAALASRGWLERDPVSKRYRLGVRLWQLGTLALADRDYRSVARPYMQSLVEATDESTELGILDGVHVVYVDRVEGHQPVRVFSRIGTRRPAHTLAMGKALISGLSRENRIRHLSLPLARYTDRTIVDLDRFHVECDEVVERGYALNRGELHIEASGIAAPVLDHRGECVAAVSFDMPSSRMTEERSAYFGPMLVQAASNISRELGFVR
jgi:DNA-binding IclR family transcriptional regulator